jgi:hypothetical protein
MTNINLTTKDEDIEGNSSAREWGPLFLAIVIAVIIYLGILGYSYWLSQDLEEKNKEYETKYNVLLEKRKSVFDFQNRLESARPLIKEKNYALEILGQIEKAIVPEVYLEFFDFNAEKKQINLNFVAKQYRLVANQIASLKKLDYFSEIEISETKVRDDGKISFPLKLTIRDN